MSLSRSGASCSPRSHRHLRARIADRGGIAQLCRADRGPGRRRTRRRGDHGRGDQHLVDRHRAQEAAHILRVSLALLRRESAHAQHVRPHVRPRQQPGPDHWRELHKPRLVAVVLLCEAHPLVWLLTRADDADQPARGRPVRGCHHLPHPAHQDARATRQATSLPAPRAAGHAGRRPCARYRRVRLTRDQP